MFGIGLPELIVIMIVALLVVGPKKLPELARSFGKALQDLRKMTDDVKHTLENEMVEDLSQPDDAGTKNEAAESREGTGEKESNPYFGTEDEKGNNAKKATVDK